MMVFPISELNTLLSIIGLKLVIVDIPIDSQNSICDFCDVRDIVVNNNLATIFDFNTGICPKCPFNEICLSLEEAPENQYIVMSANNFNPQDFDKANFILEIIGEAEIFIDDNFKTENTNEHN